MKPSRKPSLYKLRYCLKLTLNQSLAVLLTLPALMLSTQAPAQACACCAMPNTLSQSPEASSKVLVPGLRLNGNLLASSDLMHEPMIDPGRLQTSGTAAKGLIRLVVARGGKPLGTITLRPKGPASHEFTGLDFILPKPELGKVVSEPETPLYHELSQPVAIETSPELKQALGLSFGADATLRFHGLGNACWNSAEFAGSWTLSFAYVKGRLLERGLARGSSAPPQP